MEENLGCLIKGHKPGNVGTPIDGRYPGLCLNCGQELVWDEGAPGDEWEEVE